MCWLTLQLQYCGDRIAACRQQHSPFREQPVMPMCFMSMRLPSDSSIMSKVRLTAHAQAVIADAEWSTPYSS